MRTNVIWREARGYIQAFVKYQGIMGPGDDRSVQLASPLRTVFLLSCLIFIPPSVKLQVCCMCWYTRYYMPPVSLLLHPYEYRKPSGHIVREHKLRMTSTRRFHPLDRTIRTDVSLRIIRTYYMPLASLLLMLYHQGQIADFGVHIA